jgi:LysR family transcriptional regulator, transcription activator of glutamate synthase operon
MAGVEFRQLVYFDAVVRHGGFTRASGQLHVAQSALSAQILRLEKELGVSLLVRGTRSIALTPAGKLFLDRTRRVLDELDAARGDLLDLTSAVSGQVTIGATQILGPIDLATTLARFHAEHPNVAIRLRSGLIAELLDGLDAGKVDLLLGPIHDDLPSRYSAQPMFLEHVMLVTPPGHRLGGRPEVGIEEVSDEAFVCLCPGSGLRAILTAAADAAGFTPRVQFETDSPRGIRELVSAGLGVAILARSAVDALGPPVHSHQVQPSPPHPPFGLIHHRDRRLTPAAQACRVTFLRFAALNRSDPEPADAYISGYALLEGLQGEETGC